MPIMSPATEKTTPSEVVEGTSVDAPSNPSPVVPPPSALKQTLGQEPDITARSMGVTWGGNKNIKTGSTTTKYAKAYANANMSDESFRRQKIQQETTNHVFLPWDPRYRTWWGFSVFMSIMTIFYETYIIAFSQTESLTDPSAIVGYAFLAIFFLDMVINFNLAFYNAQEELITDHREIAHKYLRLMFWVDFVGVFPFDWCALAIAGQINEDSNLARYISLLGLLRLVRLHRVKQLFDVLQYSTSISLTTFTLTRNFGFALIWTHTNACAVYFIGRQYGFDDNTLLGSGVHEMSQFQRYVTYLYWSVVTMTTVGYGDLHPVNSAEMLYDIMYMLTNMVIVAWMIGSITLLVVKRDEITSEYRDTVQSLDQYAKMHHFDRRFRKRLISQAKLYFKNRQIADEEVLRNLPFSVKRKVWRRLYMPSLLQTNLMKGIRQQVVDAFLTKSTVEIFSAGEEIISRGQTSTDLFLVVEGKVALLDLKGDDRRDNDGSDGLEREGNRSLHDANSMPESDPGLSESSVARKLGPGHFINDVSFFTETPNVKTARTVTVVKTLTLSQAAYKTIGEDHPGSISKLLANLLRKVEEDVDEFGLNDLTLTKRLEVMRAGSVFDMDVSRARGFEDNSESFDISKAAASIQARSAVVAAKEVIKMHLDKMKDDHTTRFLFAAARDHTPTIALMCDQGFDPDNTDYDHRTALMIASMKGHVETVKKLLDFDANPNLTDSRGTTALHEAVKNCHGDVISVLLERGAKLCMSEHDAAETLCNAISEGDTVKLRLYLKANVQVNACDYDKRAAVHIAAAEGNLVALKSLLEYGADPSIQDRWGATAMDQAKKAKAQHIVDYLEKHQKGK